jgi:hypothetical protein
MAATNAHVTLNRADLDDQLRAAVLADASERFDAKPTWVTFFREVLGAEGTIRRAYPDPASRHEFERSLECRQIQALLRTLRGGDEHDYRPRVSKSVITVRLPTELHESLLDEAHRHETSLNQLAISKLLRPLEDDADLNDDLYADLERDSQTPPETGKE